MNRHLLFIRCTDLHSVPTTFAIKIISWCVYLMKINVNCTYPGCSNSTGLERCGNADGRLACSLHRTLRNGSYICVSCDEENAVAQGIVKARAAHAGARWGAGAVAVGGVAIAYFGFDGSTNSVFSLLLGIVMTILVVWYWYRTSGFQPLRVAGLPRGEQLLCQIITVGGNAIIAVIGFLVATLAVWNAEHAARERQKETIAEGVRRGIDRTRQ